ncbi:MAG: hypothetical protein ACKORY_11620, partial [Actinomycetota bacterium]
VFATRDKAVEPLVAQAARKLKRALADEQNGVLEHLRNKRASLDIDAVLGTVKEHAARDAAVVGDESMTAASAGVKSVRGAGAFSIDGCGSSRGRSGTAWGRRSNNDTTFVAWAGVSAGSSPCSSTGSGMTSSISSVTTGWSCTSASTSASNSTSMT